MAERPVALVTGASAGLGAAFCRALAGEGHNLVMVARGHDRLQTSADDLTARYGVDCELLPADLSSPAGCQLVAERLRSDSHPVRMLVNNAGFGLYGRFTDHPIAAEQRLLDLHVRAVLVLTQAAVQAMAGRGGGDIVNVSSVGGFVPRASGPTYAASKAWVTAFTEALSQQLVDSPVRVCALCPGYTQTEFHDRARVDMSGVPDWMWLDADRVVTAGLADLRRGKPISVPTLRYKALVAAVKLLPRPLIRRATRSA